MTNVVTQSRQLPSQLARQCPRINW
uniref:Uncharacterized protein n=1 Tax=Anguilla anguilla TaxID=7936 RepID=A0A0E9VYP4_ANGAN